MSGKCTRCGTPLIEAKNKKRQFCSNKCKQAAHRERRELTSTESGRALLAKWNDELRFNRLTIHYLTHVYMKFGLDEAHYATHILGLLRDGLDIKS